MAEKKKNQVWLDAYYDALANLDVYSECLGLADVNGFGKYSLVAADATKKLKTLRGVQWSKPYPLLGRPSSMCIFYNDTREPRIPLVAVASGDTVWVHRLMRPHHQIKIPPLAVPEAESKLWLACREKKSSATKLCEGLRALRDDGVNLTPYAVDLLSVSEGKALDSLLARLLPTFDKQTTSVTCMGTVTVDHDEPRAVSMLLIGTENREIHYCEPRTLEIKTTVRVPAVPFAIATQGPYSLDPRVVVGCRDNTLYTLRNEKLLGKAIELESALVGLSIVRRSIVVATTDQTIHCFTYKGVKSFSLYLPKPITNLSTMKLTQIRQFEGFLVALADGEVRLYNGRDHINSIHTGSAVTGIVFGPFGTEPANLVLVHGNKSLTLKTLRRQAKLEIDASERKKKIREADEPLQIPRKTRLYVEQTMRETKHATEMHRKFRRDLCKLRLATAKAYVKVIESGQGPLSASGAIPLALDADVEGLGPCFKIKLVLKNTGKKALYGVPINVVFDQEVYSVDKPLFRFSSLVPGLEYTTEVNVMCIDPAGASSPIQIFVCNTKSCVPIISAIAHMPISEVEEEDR